MKLCEGWTSSTKGCDQPGRRSTGSTPPSRRSGFVSDGVGEGSFATVDFCDVDRISIPLDISGESAFRARSFLETVGAMSLVEEGSGGCGAYPKFRLGTDFPDWLSGPDQERSVANDGFRGADRIDQVQVLDQVPSRSWPLDFSLLGHLQGIFNLDAR